MNNFFQFFKKMIATLLIASVLIGSADSAFYDNNPTAETQSGGFDSVEQI